MKTIKKISILILLFLTSCTNSKDDLELVIINDSINCINTTKEKYYSMKKSDENNGINKKALTLVRYKLTNNSDQTYFFCIPHKTDNYFKLHNVFLKIYNQKNESIESRIYNSSISSVSDIVTKEAFDIYSNKIMNLPINHSSLNFAIHPNETLFFQWYIILPYGSFLEENSNYIILNSNDKYYVKMYLKSIQSSELLSQSEIEEIKTNKYKIFNGILESKNKVKIKINN